MSKLAERLGRYVETRGMGEEHKVYLTIDHQGFCVTPYGCEDADQAEWFRGQLLIALERLVRTERIRLRMPRGGPAEPVGGVSRPGVDDQPRLPF